MLWMQREAKKKYKGNDSLLEKVCAIRGIEDLNSWINPPSKFEHSPYKLLNIDSLVQRIVTAIHKGEKIVIVADIDGDGVCSTGIMYNYLKSLTDNISYIHAQRSIGHGVEKVLNKVEDDVQLIIVVDSSSNSVEGCKYLYDKGIDVLVIDHHEIDTENPFATIVNCQQGGYLNPHLSGSAMCYKVCQVLDEYLDIDMADDFLDLCAIGLVGDMMSVEDMENRYLIYNGINKIDNLGIKEILKQSNIDFSEGITTTNISFKVSPILSACSRFDQIELALELITTDDESKIKTLAKKMIELNERRKKEQKEIVESIIEDIDHENNLIIIVNNDIDSGMRGLVAQEVVERFSKPVFILSETYNKDGSLIGYEGSARSVGLIQLKDLCQKSGLFNFATGHQQAHGVNFNAENLKKIVDYFNKKLNTEDLVHVVEYDLEVNIDDIDIMDIKEIEVFSKIVGQSFPEPLFKITGIVLEEGHSKKLGTYVRAVMGSNLDTIKFHSENGFALMKFRTNENYGEDIENHFNNNFATELNVVGTLTINKFYNWGTKKLEVTPQVFMVDYEIID